MPYDPRDPDAQLVATFHLRGFQNDAKTIKAGRPIYDDIEICEIRVPGSREVKVFPAVEFSHWGDGPDGRPVKVTYAERFKYQYRQFKEHAQQTKSGTPLTHVPFLTEGKRAELRAMNIYTVEQLAAIEGAELKNLGAYGRESKNKAAEYLDDARKGAPNSQLMAELEAMKARAAVLEDDNAAMKLLQQQHAEHESGDDVLDGMSNEQLKDLIATGTGNRPVGNPSRKSLLRMAQDARPESKSRVA